MGNCRFNTIRAVIVSAIVMIFSPVRNAQAADHVLTITNNSMNATEAVIFDYGNIGPGFSDDTPLMILNDSDFEAELLFSPVALSDEDPNLLFPRVNLSLIYPGATIMNSASGSTDVDMLDAVLCMPPDSSIELISHFDVPTTVGNHAQNTTLSLGYELDVSVGPECSEDTPRVPYTPNTGAGSLPNQLPPSGEGMATIYILCGIAAMSFAAVVVFGTAFLVSRSRKKA